GHQALHALDHEFRVGQNAEERQDASGARQAADGAQSRGGGPFLPAGQRGYLIADAEEVRRLGAVDARALNDVIVVREPAVDVDPLRTAPFDVRHVLPSYGHAAIEALGELLIE